MVRVKRRYFVLRLEFVESNQKLRKKYHLMEAIFNKVQELHGEFGLAAVRNAFMIKHDNPETGVFYVRVDRNVADLLSSSLPLITEIEKKYATVSCLFTAATIRHANIFLKNYHEKVLNEETKAADLKVSLKQNVVKKRKKRV